MVVMVVVVVVVVVMVVVVVVVVVCRGCGEGGHWWRCCIVIVSETVCISYGGGVRVVVRGGDIRVCAKCNTASCTLARTWKLRVVDWFHGWFQCMIRMNRRCCGTVRGEMCKGCQQHMFLKQRVRKCYTVDLTSALYTCSHRETASCKLVPRLVSMHDTRESTLLRNPTRGNVQSMPTTHVSRG